MSSVPLANSGNIARIGLLGCNAKSSPNNVQSQRLDAPHDQEPCTPPESQASNSNGKTVESASANSDRSQQRPSTNGNANGHSNGKEALDDMIKSNHASSSHAPINAGQPPTNGHSAKGPLHRIRQVREQQGVSVRSIARRLGIDVRSYRRLEDPANDLTISQLHAVQQALDVPLADLLEDRQSLSRPVEERAKLVKVMKTAVAIRETKSNLRISRMAQMLCEQLVDVMPELSEVGGWPQFGARRGQSALGKALRQPIDTSQINHHD